jgi:hypothetical protein
MAHEHCFRYRIETKVNVSETEKEESSKWGNLEWGGGIDAESKGKMQILTSFIETVSVFR